MTPEELEVVQTEAELLTLRAAQAYVAQRAEDFTAWHEERKRRSDRWTGLLDEQRSLAQRLTNIRAEIDAAKRDLDEWDTRKPEPS